MESASPAIRQHRVLVRVLIVLGAIFGLLAVHAVWANRQALETDEWTKTSSALLENEDIQEAVSTFLVDELYDNVDIQGEIEQALPPRLAPLAGPAAGGLRELANDLALKALQSPKVQALWEDANRLAQEHVLAVIEDKSDVLKLEGDDATLDLHTLLTDLAQRVGIGSRIVDKLPADAGQVTILRSDQIGLAQDGVRALRALALGLSLVALGLFALAVYLARGWRRVAARSVGYAFIFVGVAVLAIRSFAGDELVSALASTSAVEPAINSTWQIGTSLLHASAVGLIGYGLFIICGTWLAGPTSPARTLRRGLTPYLRERWIAYAGIVVIILLVLWWNPTPGTSRLLPTLALIAILIALVEGIRSQGMKDFPDAQRGELRAELRGVIAARRGRSAPDAASDEKRLAQLERLADLKRSGVLSDEELAAEKARLLGEA